MERSGCNSWDRPGHSARELERQAAGDILICAAMCKGMHLQPGSVPVIRPAGIFSEDEGKHGEAGGGVQRAGTLAETHNFLLSAYRAEIGVASSSEVTGCDVNRL